MTKAEALRLTTAISQQPAGYHVLGLRRYRAPLGQGGGFWAWCVELAPPSGTGKVSVCDTADWRRLQERSTS
jgi:hypothetical protein